MFAMTLPTLIIVWFAMRKSLPRNQFVIDPLDALRVQLAQIEALMLHVSHSRMALYALEREKRRIEQAVETLEAMRPNRIAAIGWMEK